MLQRLLIATRHQATKTLLSFTNEVTFLQASSRRSIASAPPAWLSGNSNTLSNLSRLARSSHIADFASPLALTQLRNVSTTTERKGPRRQNKLKISEAEARKQPRRVKAYCTADEYDFDELTKFLSKHHVTTFLSDTTLHIRKTLRNTLDASEAQAVDEPASDIFYFKNGCIVAWGSTAEEERRLLDEVRQFEIKPTGLPESEEMEWILGGQSGLKYGSVIVVNSEAEEREKMHDQLAFSWGLVHSVKISALEEYAAMTLDKMRDIPQDLGRTGKLQMTSGEIYKMFGEFLSLQGYLNSNLLETPDLYWEEPELEELYKKISRDLELQQRLKRLEQRLNYGRELMEVLRTLTSEKHFTKLEKIIIILIATEVLLSIRHEIKDFLFGDEKKEATQ